MSTPNDPVSRFDFQAYNPFERFDQVEGIWKAMLEKCRHSYFISWGWISTWIKSLPAESGVRLIVGSLNQRVVLAFFVGARKYLKYGAIPSRALSLNSTGDPLYDVLYVEYNSMLVDETTGFHIRELLTYLESQQWDEFVFPGMSPSSIGGDRRDFGERMGEFYVLIDALRASYYVDLDKVRAAEMDFMKLLSANKRSQIRRSIKQYELDGNVEVDESRNLDEALAMFDEMVALHQKEWQRRGEPGVFSNNYMLRFHKALIRSRFDRGEIQLLKIGTDSKVIGYLYSFVYCGDVLFYQSGFNYEAENVYRPGLVSHYYAVLHNAGRGAKTYDFLAGEAEYKKSLSTDTTPMYWMRWIRRRPRYYFEKNVLALKKYVLGMPGLAKKLMRLRNLLRSARG